MEGNPLPGAIGLGLTGGIVPGLFGFEGFDPLDACRQPLMAEPEGVTSVEVLPPDLGPQAVAGPRPQRVDGADFRLRRRGLLRRLGPERSAGRGKASQEGGCDGQAPEPAIRFCWEHPATHGMNGPILAPVHRRCYRRGEGYGMTTSWERGRPARTRPGTASPISPTSINREGCLWFAPGSGGGGGSVGRDRMRAGRPRSQEGESQKPSRKAKADAVGEHRAGAGGSIFFCYEHRLTGWTG